MMISVAGWELFLTLFLSTKQLIHHWDAKFWAARYFQPASQQRLPLLFEEAGCEPQLHFPKEDIGEKMVGQKRPLPIFARIWVNRKMEGAFIISWWHRLCHGYPNSYRLLGCVPILPLILACARTFPKSPPTSVSLCCQKGKYYCLSLKKPTYRTLPTWSKSLGFTASPGTEEPCFPWGSLSAGASQAMAVASP